MKPTVLLVAHPGKPEALRLADDAAAFLRRRAHVLPVVKDLDAPLCHLDAGLAVAFGGDGTVLSAARRLLQGAAAAPLLGVNLGRLGYLAAVEPPRLEEALTAAIAGELRETPRMTLAAEVVRDGRAAWTGPAVNEFLLAASSPGRIIRLQVAVGREPLMEFPGDGLIVATATGSTAHALSAGGPLLSPQLRAMVVAPVCPHRLSIRPVIVDAGEAIVLRHTGATPERLAADGRHAADILPGDEVWIRAGARPFRWLSWRTGLFDPLRRKLGWSNGA